MIARPRGEVFEFFSRPENLERITPGWVGFRLLTPQPIDMKAGAVLDYTIRLLGLPVRWTTLISDYEPPHRFSDVALRGPYRFWCHTHTFEKDGQETIMIDEVRYALPFGILGDLVHRLWVRRQLDCIFDYRAEVIGEIFGASEAGSSDDKASGEVSECARR
jgi:ligand-binding SRPBCC domain-containing protein